MKGYKTPGIWTKKPIVITDIDGTLVSEKTGKLHPIIVPMLVAIQRVVEVQVMTSRHRNRLEQTRRFLEGINLDVAIWYNAAEESPFAFKKRTLDNLRGACSIQLLIDNDREVLKYAASLGIPVILP